MRFTVIQKLFLRQKSLLLYMNLISFCVLTMSCNCVELFISFNSLSVESFSSSIICIYVHMQMHEGFYRCIYKVISLIDKNNVTSSFLACIPLFSFCFLLALDEVSRSIVNNNMRMGILICILS